MVEMDTVEAPLAEDLAVVERVDELVLRRRFSSSSESMLTSSAELGWCVLEAVVVDVLKVELPEIEGGGVIDKIRTVGRTIVTDWVSMEVHMPTANAAPLSTPAVATVAFTNSGCLISRYGR